MSKSFTPLEDRLDEYRHIEFRCFVLRGRRFENAIKKAMDSCKQSGNDPQNHFASAGKMVGIGSQADRDLEDYHLSRFACYLIAQNGDPRKSESGAARDAGVQDKMFGIFRDAGYKGLSAGLGVDAIKARKGIAPKEQLMDRTLGSR